MRNVSETLYQSWLEIVELAFTIQLTNDEDEIVWQFTSKGVYSSQSLYKIINFRGIKQVHLSVVWSLKIPPRVHMFLWFLINNRVLTRDNLAKRKKVEDESCLFCSEKETCQHLFFDCAIASHCWSLFSEILSIPMGNNIFNVGKYWLSSKRYVVVNMVTSAVIWSIWKLRNELCFQKIGWKDMEVLLFKILGILKSWVVLCPGDKKEILSGYKEEIKESARRVRWLPNF
jgi:hypothetical protein